VLAARILAVVLSGASMRLVSPPIGLHQLHWFNLVLAFWALRQGEDRRNGWLMYLFGCSLISFNYSWISESVMNFSNFHPALAWGCVIGYAALAAIPFWILGWSAHWLRDRTGNGWIWLLPGLQVAIEKCWPALFPYYHGALLYRTEWIWQFASVLGVTSLSYLLYLSNAALCEFLVYSKRRLNAGLHLAAFGLLFSTICIFGAWRHGQVEETLSEAPKLRVAILQQDVTMEHRLSRNPWESIRDWTNLTLQASKDKPDLVVWPEGAMGGPLNPDDDHPYNALGGRSLHSFFSELSSQFSFDFLVGGGTTTFHDELDENGYPTYTAFNSAYLFNKKGEITGRYDKMVLLPFGEYIPLSDTFPVIRKIIRGPGNFQAGEKVTYFKAGDEDSQYSFSTPICYEAILSSQMEKMVDADLFINITNDAWFGDTASTHQHGMLAAVQPMEWGRPLLRIGYTGVSFVVEPHGRVLYETRAFEEVAKVEVLRRGTVETLYRKGGWVFPWIWVLAIPPLFFVLGRKERIEADSAASMQKK
jgi:apolipoprotein N-acyltransferase